MTGGRVRGVAVRSSGTRRRFGRLRGDVLEHRPVERVHARAGEPDLAEVEREDRVLVVAGVVVGLAVAGQDGEVRVAAEGVVELRQGAPARRPRRPIRPRASARRPRCPPCPAAGPPRGTGFAERPVVREVAVVAERVPAGRVVERLRVRQADRRELRRPAQVHEQRPRLLVARRVARAGRRGTPRCRDASGATRRPSSHVAPQPKPASPNRSSRSVNGHSSAIRNGVVGDRDVLLAHRGDDTDVTEVAFARSGDVSIAYRVVGDGPIDLVYVQGAFTHLDVYWELPAFRRYCERLGEFSRLILFDKRGMGMSDRVPGRHAARRAHGRHPGRHGRGRLRVGGGHGRVRGRPARHPVRGRAPRADAGADPPGRRGPRAHRRGLAVGRSDRRASSRPAIARIAERWGKSGRGRRRAGPVDRERPGPPGDRGVVAEGPAQRRDARPAGRRSPGWRSTSTSATSSRRSTSRR